MTNLVYLDTDVWINYIIYLRNKELRSNNKKTLPLEKITDTSIEIFVSEINLIEISEKLADEKRMMNCFQDGMSILEMRKDTLMKSEITLDELADIKSEIDQSIFTLKNLVSDKTPTIDPTTLKNLTILCTQYSIFFIDALHFEMADRLGCTYFISGDNELCQKLNKISSEVDGRDNKIKVCHCSSFKNQEFSQWIRSHVSK